MITVSVTGDNPFHFLVKPDLLLHNSVVVFCVLTEKLVHLYISGLRKSLDSDDPRFGLSLDFYRGYLDEPFPDHHWSLPLGPEACEDSALQGCPDPVGEIEESGLDAEHEGDPLVVGGVGGVVLAVDALLLHDAPEVGLVLGGDVGAPVDPAVVLGNLRADALELAAERNENMF